MGVLGSPPGCPQHLGVAAHSQVIVGAPELDQAWGGPQKGGRGVLGPAPHGRELPVGVGAAQPRQAPPKNRLVGEGVLWGGAKRVRGAPRNCHSTPDSPTAPQNPPEPPKIPLRPPPPKSTLWGKAFSGWGGKGWRDTPKHPTPPHCTPEFPHTPLCTPKSLQRPYCTPKPPCRKRRLLGGTPKHPKPPPAPRQTRPPPHPKPSHCTPKPP